MVRLRLSDNRCQKDLHTADARYHDGYRASFMAPRNVKAAKQSSHDKDDILISVISTMSSDRSKAWSSVELFAKYSQLNGPITSRWWFVDKLNEHFALLVYYYSTKSCKAGVYMQDTTGSSKLIDIAQTVSKHRNIMSSLTAIHALTGCDSTSRFEGIGKKTALKTATQKKLVYMGSTAADESNVIQEATDLIGWCYGIKAGADMSEKGDYTLFLRNLILTYKKLISLILVDI